MWSRAGLICSTVIHRVGVWMCSLGGVAVSVLCLLLDPVMNVSVSVMMSGVRGVNFCM